MAVGRSLPTSVLPLILDLAQQEQLHLCFVRVRRRPENGHAPQTAALRRSAAGWLFFRETDPQYSRRFLLLSPADSTPDERRLGLYLVAMTATWAVPLFVDDLWALARERQPWLADWMVGRATRPGFVGAQLAGAGVLVTLILVLRSHVSLDFIYFQF